MSTTGESVWNRIRSGGTVAQSAGTVRDAAVLRPVEQGRLRVEISERHGEAAEPLGSSSV